MAPFFSIIIPCCNVEPYVRECLESVIMQSFTDWECLVVIEDSTDRTEQIAREICTTHNQFTIITEPRSGSPATPRNTGLKSARGDYIIFLDGDDFLIENTLAEIAAKIKEHPNADLYPSSFLEQNEITEEVIILNDYPINSPSKLSGKEAIIYLDSFWLSPQPTVFRTIYRRSFLMNANLRFYPGLVHEDEEFTPRAMYRATQIVPLHIPFYHYRRRNNSITTTKNNDLLHLTNYAIVFRSLFAFHTMVSVEPDYSREVAACWAKSWISKLFILWFSEHFVKEIPRQQRRDTLKVLFSNGFDDFNALLQVSSYKRRFAGWWVRLFVSRPSWAWASELFFLKIYFPLTNLKLNRFIRKIKKQ